MSPCKYNEYCRRPCPDSPEDCARYIAAEEVGIKNIPDDVTTIAYWRIPELIKQHCCK
jgi:hypothetical protein